VTDTSNVVFVTDFLLSDCAGGAEMVDDYIIKSLNLTAIRTRDLKNVDPSKLYLLSNTFQMLPYMRAIFQIYQNYVVFEHDYKIHPTRQPNLFPNNIIPIQERINYDFYRNARCVFLQSVDHHQCFIDNEVPGTFKTLHTSLWSKEELDLLRTLKQVPKTINKIAIADNPHPAKGTKESIEYCLANNLEYDLIPKMRKEDFYNTIAKYKGLAYFPRVKESFCRLVVEAKAMLLDVYTGNNFGVTKEPWFHELDKDKIIDYLEEGTRKALEEIKKEII
jgi:hypothetical protein